MAIVELIISNLSSLDKNLLYFLDFIFIFHVSAFILCIAFFLKDACCQSEQEIKDGQEKS